MKEMAAAAKTIAGMFDGKLAYDAAAFKATAETIRAHTGPALIAEFPSATLGAPSGVRPDIDLARPEFEALARHIGTLASALAADAEQAPAGITNDIRMGSGLVMGLASGRACPKPIPPNFRRSTFCILSCRIAQAVIRSIRQKVQ